MNYWNRFFILGMFAIGSFISPLTSQALNGPKIPDRDSGKVRILVGAIQNGNLKQENQAYNQEYKEALIQDYLNVTYYKYSETIKPEIMKILIR